MAKLTPDEYAAKHATRLKAASEDIRRGVSRVQTAPGQAAVRQQEKLKQNFAASVDSGRWASATGAVSLQEWQQQTTEKGIPRISAGIDAAQGKQVQMAGRLLSAVDSVAGKVKTMPSTTLEDNIQRMTTFARGMAQFKGKIKVG